MSTAVTPRPAPVVSVTQSDPVAAAASEVIGGPRGTRVAGAGGAGGQVAGAGGAGTRGGRTGGGGSAWMRRVLALTVAASGVTMAVSVLLRSHCLAFGWSSPDEFFHVCYTDYASSYASDHLGLGLGGLLSGASGSSPTEAPLTSLLMALVGGLVPANDLAPGALTTGPRALVSTQGTLGFVVAWAVITTILVALTCICIAVAHPRTPWRAMYVAASPVVALVALVAPDPLGVALTAAGLLAWSRRRVVLAGVLLGLACTAQSWPLLVLVVLLLVALRTGKVATWAMTMGAAALTAGIVVVALALARPSVVSSAYADWLGREAGLGSPWIIAHIADHPLPAVALTVLAVLGWAVALSLGAYLALAARVRPSIGELAVVVIGVVALTGKQLPVQTSLWLVLAVALAGLPWRVVLTWAGAEALHFVCAWLYLASSGAPDRALPGGWYVVPLVLRLLAIAWLVWTAWLQAWDRVPARGYVEPAAPEPPASQAIAAAPEAPAREAVAGEASASGSAYPGTNPGPDHRPDGLGRVPEHDELAGPCAGAPDALTVVVG